MQTETSSYGQTRRFSDHFSWQTCTGILIKSLNLKCNFNHGDIKNKKSKNLEWQQNKTFDFVRQNRSAINSTRCCWQTLWWKSKKLRRLRELKLQEKTPAIHRSLISTRHWQSLLTASARQTHHRRSKSTTKISSRANHRSGCESLQKRPRNDKWSSCMMASSCILGTCSRLPRRLIFQPLQCSQNRRVHCKLSSVLHLQR